MKYPLAHGTGHMLALAPDASTVYVSHVKPGRLSIIDAASGVVRSSLSLPDGAEGLAIAPDGGSVWVASHQASRISVVSAEKGTVTRSIVCPGMPFRMKFSPDGVMLAVSCPGAGALALISVASPAQVEFVDTNLLNGEPIGVQHVPTSLAFSRDGARVFAVCSGQEGSVVAIDVASRALTKRVKSTGPIADALTAGLILWSAD
ncbi:MAG: YncE family protein [Planctomycetota bacterium]|nr:YncE family protein [Planctomycetota bacterium]